MFYFTCDRSFTDLVAADTDGWFIQQTVNDVNYSIGCPEISTYNSGTLTESMQTKHQLITLHSSNKLKVSDCFFLFTFAMLNFQGE